MSGAIEALSARYGSFTRQSLQNAVKAGRIAAAKAKGTVWPRVYLKADVDGYVAPNKAKANGRGDARLDGFSMKRGGVWSESKSALLQDLKPGEGIEFSVADPKKAIQWVWRRHYAGGLLAGRKFSGFITGARRFAVVVRG